MAPYPRRVEEVAWLQQHMELLVLWVADSGELQLQPPGGGDGWWSILAS
jgi:hypothetical protein